MNSPQAPRPSVEKGGFVRTVKMVAWAFLGIRKGSEWKEDMSHAKPVHVIAVGLVLAAVFVATLVLVVKWVVPH